MYRDSSSYTNNPVQRAASNSAIVTVSEAISFLNKQYDFDNLATKDEVSKIKQLLSQFQSSIFGKINDIYEDQKRDSNALKTTLQRAKDDINMVSDNFNHITQSISSSNTRLEETIESNIRRLKSDIKREQQTETRKILSETIRSKQSIAELQRSNGESFVRLQGLAQIVDEISRVTQNIKPFIDNKFRTVIDNERQRNITARGLFANQKSLNNKIGQILVANKKFVGIVAKYNNELQKEIISTAESFTPQLATG